MIASWGSPPNHSAAAPPQNTANSTASRTGPETATGAEPDRLGSSGTANTPHTAAASIGNNTTSNQRAGLSVTRQPRIANEAKADSSSRNRRPSMAGFRDTGRSYDRATLPSRSARADYRGAGGAVVHTAPVAVGEQCRHHEGQQDL